MDSFGSNINKLLSDDRDVKDIDYSKELSGDTKSFDDSLESLLGVDLTEREVEENILDIFLSESDIENTIIQNEFEKVMNKADSEAERIDMSKEMPNLTEEVVTEAIFVEGNYNIKVRDFIMNDNILPVGGIPIAFEINNEIVMIKKINPEPKYLYIISKVLVGYKLYYMNEEGREKLDIYKFLGRPNLSGGL